MTIQDEVQATLSKLLAAGHAPLDIAGVLLGCALRGITVADPKITLDQIIVIVTNSYNRMKGEQPS